MNKQAPVEIDGISGEVETIPTPKGTRYRCKLDTLADVKREMARIYREARTELIDTQTASKQVWILQSIGKVIEGSDLEKRIEQLEASK
jgi:hypothetical protein